MYNWDSFYFKSLLNCTFYLTKDKIQYQYDHLFAHRTDFHNHTLTNGCVNMNRKQYKNVDNSEVYFDST